MIPVNLFTQFKLLLITLYSISIFAQDSASCETIMFIKEKGIDYRKYVNISTNIDDKQQRLFYAISKHKDHLENIVYSNPKDYQINNLPNQPYNMMIFSGNYYSVLEEGNLIDDNEVHIENNIYTFRNPKHLDSAGYYGYSWREGIYKAFTFTWVIPENFEFVKYNCNRGGDWKLRNSSLTYYGEDVNRILFNVSFKKKNIRSEESHLDRSINIKDSIIISNESIQIEVWDHNKIDGDIVTLYLNDEKICNKMTLSNEKTIFTVNVSKGDNMLILHADNLGSIPPNTAAITINGAGKEYTKILNSDMGVSESILIRVK